MKKKIFILVLSFLLTLCCGCATSAEVQHLKEEKPSDEKIRLEEKESGEQEPEPQEQEQQEPEQQEPEQQEPEQQSNAEVEEDFGFQELSDYVFYFSSGAGAWYTELRINEDGTFKGHYQDADMGDAGEGYADGTLYVCDFTGQYGDLEKVDDFTWKMKLESLVFEREAGEEEIIDNVRNIYATAYGIDNGEEFYLYLPGAEFSDLPEGFKDWVRNSCPDGRAEEKLSFYGLYNEKTEEGFSSYAYQEQSLSEDIALEISIAENYEADWKERHKDSGSQSEMNMASAELYQKWDDTLNIIWKLLESELDETAMEQLRAEEREWINFKETEVKAAGKEMEGGSMQPFLESEKATELTKERVYELAQYAK